MEKRTDLSITSFAARPKKEKGFHKDHIEHLFFQKDFITAEDIKTYVDLVLDVTDITQKTQHEIRQYLVLDVLNFDTMFSWLQDRTSEIIELDSETRDVVSSQIDRLRQGVLHELKRRNILLPRDILILECYYNDQASDETESPVVAYGVDGNNTEAVFRDWKTADYSDDSVVNRNLHREREGYTRAMLLFLDAIKKHPDDHRIQYFPRINGFDRSGRGTIVEHLRILPLSKILEEIYKDDKPTSWEALQPELYLLLESLEAATFLQENGLMLRDICPENIALDTQTGNAILHDIGALVCIGEEQVDGIAHKGYFPPEIQEKPNIAASSLEMVYQFGRVIETLAGASALGADEGYLYDIAAKMTCRNPEERITLDAAIQAINQLIEKGNK